jgi:hypothetical protein
MRVKNQDQPAFLTVLNPNDRIPADHLIEHFSAAGRLLGVCVEEEFRAQGRGK